MVAAAVIGAGVIGAVGSSVAGSSAASATRDSTNASINAQNSAQAKQQALNAPYAAIGTGATGSGGAIDQYQDLLGLGPKGSAGIEQTLAATPGYQFQQQQGTQNTVNQASAMGLGLSGNTLEGLSKFNSGLADTTYQQAVGNAQNAVTIGQNAAAGTGAGVLQTGANVGNALVNQGNTLAGIDANTIAGITKSAGNTANGLITANTLAGLNNPSGGVDTGWISSQANNTINNDPFINQPITSITG
jgi:hypothetical protein